MAEVTAMRHCALPYEVYGLPWVVVFPVLDADGDFVTGMATPDAEVSLNGDTFVDCTNEAVEIATASGLYYVIMTAAQMTADIVVFQQKSATAGMKPTPIVLRPRKLVTIRAGTSASAGSATTTIVLDSGASAEDDFYNGMVVAAVIDGTTEVRMIGDYTGSTKTATIVGPDWITAPDNTDTFTIYLPDGIQLHQANVTQWLGTAPATPTVNGVPEVDLTHVAGSTTSVSALASGMATLLADWINGGRLDLILDIIAADTTTDIPALIATLQAFVDTEVQAIKDKTDNLPTDPADESLIIAATDAIMTRIGAAGAGLTALGDARIVNLDAAVSTRASQTSVDDLPTNAELATSQAAADDATLAAIAALNNLSAAQVNAEVLDVLNVDTFAEPGQEAPAATNTLVKKIGYLFKLARNRVTQTSTTLKVYADDATTVDQKATVGDDATTYDRGELGTGP